jgi:thioredoxin-like negative regulator of GroEL
MAYPSSRRKQLAEALEHALLELGLGVSEPVYDAWLDPGALREAVRRDAELVVRAGEPLEEAPEGFAARPGKLVWLHLGVRGDSEVRAYAVDGLASATAVSGFVTTVVLASEREPCCDGAKCQAHKERLSITLELAEGAEATRLLVGETLTREARAAQEFVALAEALAKRFGVTLERRGDAATIAEAEAGELAVAASDASAAKARGWPGPWALRTEGALHVLRDHASRGPREGTWFEVLLTVAMAIGAVASGHQAVQSWLGGSRGESAIFGLVALVLAIATWATSHIARHSARFHASSAALLYVARDRLVMAPWMSRDGSVDVKPEGRYGAALPISDVRELYIVKRRERWILGCDSSHGPYDIGWLETQDQARAWKDALEGLLDAAAHTARGEERAKLRAGLTSAGLALLVALSLAAVACRAPDPDPPLVEPSLTPPSARPAPAPLASASSVVPAPGPKLQLIEDDVPAALAQAKKSGKALFVEVWAPWCHTCLSLKSFVLPDPSIAALGDRVVFAAIDSDRPENVAFMNRHSVNVWPTLYVLDGEGEVLGLWQGAASVRELREFIVSAVDDRDAAREPSGPLAALLSAKRAQAKSDYRGAARHYQAALDRAPADWRRKSEALAGLIFSEYRAGDFKRCAELGVAHLDAIEGAAVPTDASSVVLDCASRTKGALGAKAQDRAVARLARHTAKPPADASVDDKADALALYAEVLRAGGDQAASRRTLERQLALLEAAAKAAPSAEAAATFDYARMNSYLALGRGDQAVAMLDKRCKELPDGYEPFARLAQALVALRRHEPALRAIEEAIAKSYGPRQLGYLETKARIARTIGDGARERAALEKLIAAYAELDDKQKQIPRHRKQHRDAKERLQAMGRAPSGAAPGGSGPGKQPPGTGR